MEIILFGHVPAIAAFFQHVSGRGTAGGILWANRQDFDCFLVAKTPPNHAVVHRG